MSLAGHRHAQWALAAIAFIESSFFPVPPDVLLVPMVLADRTRAFRFAAICTIALVAGGMMGYAIGALAFETLGRYIVDFYGAGEDFQAFRDMYGEWGFLIVFAAGLTPLPYKVFTIASGVAALDPVVFVVGSLASRGLRFFFETWLLNRFGPPVYDFLQKNLWVFSAWFVFAVTGGFVAARLMF